MSKLPNCPKCNSEYTYEDMHLLVCPECAHEWSLESMEDNHKENTIEEEVIKDANGNQLNDGDSIVVLKDLKVRGSSSVIKRGTVVKNIKLIYGATDGHNIDCRIDGFGFMKLVSEFVRKS